MYSGGELPCPSVNVNTESRENDEVTQNVESWDACSELCRQREDCRHWTWHHENSGIWALKCVTMTGYGYTAPNTVVVSGERDCMGAHNKIGIKVPVTAMQGYTEGQYAFAVAIQVVIGQSVSLYNCIVYI